jgi:hypothetical protein
MQRILLTCVVVLLVAGIFLQQKNKRLTEANGKLLLQNDSVLSVNLTLQKELTCVQRRLDSLQQQQPQTERITSR